MEPAIPQLQSLLALDQTEYRHDFAFIAAGFFLTATLLAMRRRLSQTRFGIASLFAQVGREQWLQARTLPSLQAAERQPRSARSKRHALRLLSRVEPADQGLARRPQPLCPGM